MSKPISICVIGSGYVGLVASVCFAEMGHQVTCVDNDEAKIKTLREGGVPIFEHHLPELLAKHLNQRVEFTNDLSGSVERSEAIFIAVGTPQGETGAADLSYVEAVVSEIARTIEGYKVIVEKSTVPVYTNEWIRRVLHRHGVSPASFDVVSNPEFLREGSAIIDFLHPDRIVIGADSARAAALLREIYEPIIKQKFTCPIHSVCPKRKDPIFLVTDTNSGLALGAGAPPINSRRWFRQTGSVVLSMARWIPAWRRISSSLGTRRRW